MSTVSFVRSLIGVTFQRDPNLLEAESEQLSKGIAGVDIQRTTEMSYPIQLYHSIQCHRVFECTVCNVVKTYFCDWIKGTEAGIFDSVRRVRTYLWGEQIESSSGRKKQREDGKIVDISKSTTELQEQIPLFAWWVVGESV